MTADIRAAAGDFHPLGLTGVLAGTLPHTLLTPEAPDRYPVDAVFTRRPAADEVSDILGERTRTHLVDHGCPHITLHITDRRLTVANTSLEELRDGLAAVLANRLATITLDIRARNDANAARTKLRIDREHQRQSHVADLAGSIQFTVDHGHATADQTAAPA